MVVGCFVGGLNSSSLKLGEQYLGIDEIFRAAERDDVYCGRLLSFGFQLEFYDGLQVNKYDRTLIRLWLFGFAVRQIHLFG